MQKVKNPNGIGEENKIVVRKIGITTIVTTIVLVIISTIILILRQISLDTSQDALPSDTTSETSQQKNSEYKGSLLAGSLSPYLEFNKEDYEKATMSDKYIFLDFYASWCPICRAEEPDIKKGFNELATNNLVGFRVNYNDPDTDEFEKELAQNFDIPYQHTKLILYEGKEVFRTPDAWDTSDFLKNIESVVK